MGCFSFKCKVSGKPVNSSSFDGDAVHMFLLKDGKPIEYMFGNYDSYGRVFGPTKDPNDTSLTDTTSFEWNLEWGEVCDLIFNDNEGDGIAVVLDEFYNGEIPTTQSEDDPDQGWNEMEYNVEVMNPIHEVY